MASPRCAVRTARCNCISCRGKYLRDGYHRDNCTPFIITVVTFIIVWTTKNTTWSDTGKKKKNINEIHSFPLYTYLIVIYIGRPPNPKTRPRGSAPSGFLLGYRAIEDVFPSWERKSCCFFFHNTKLSQKCAIALHVREFHRIIVLL